MWYVSLMHLRVNTTKRGGKIYRYVQIVQSVRDKNGKSTTRVFKHLGLLPDPVIDALKLAMKAGQNKKTYLHRGRCQSTSSRSVPGQQTASRSCRVDRVLALAEDESPVSRRLGGQDDVI